MEAAVSKLFIITGPSGAGKTKVTEGVITLGVARKVITCTTRAPRANNGVMEVPGVDYHFLSLPEFTQRLAAGDFAEHAEVYSGKFYGTLKSDIETALTLSDAAVIVIDVQGAETLMRLYPDATSVFIEVPRADLESRLLLRGDLPKQVEDRLAAFDGEMAKIGLFDCVIPNHNNCLDQSIDTLNALIHA